MAAHDPSDCDRLLVEARDAGIERYVVGIAVRRGSELLLLKRRSDDFQPDVWEIPGGHVEDGESILGAVARELEEETGWSVKGVVGLVDWFDYDGEKGYRTREWNFEVHTAIEGEPIHPEHQAYAWATLGNYREYPMTEEMETTVGRVLRQAE